LTSRTAAVRYARALFDVVLKEQGDLSTAENDLVAFADLFRQHEALARVLLNPAVPTPRKRAAMEALTQSAGVTPVVGKLMVLLAERDRLAILPDLAAAFRERVAEHRKVVRASLVTAAPLDAERVEQIRQTLSHATGRAVTLETQVDPAIIGGMVARVGGTVFDASITTQLQKLRQRLTE
jgi:F-type H+-transporting ATPase subunit delta